MNVMCAGLVTVVKKLLTDIEVSYELMHFPDEIDDWGHVRMPAHWEALIYLGNKSVYYVTEPDQARAWGWDEIASELEEKKNDEQPR